MEKKNSDSRFSVMHDILSQAEIYRLTCIKEKLHNLVLEYNLWEQYKKNERNYEDVPNLTKLYEDKQKEVLANIDIIINGMFYEKKKLDRAYIDYLEDLIGEKLNEYLESESSRNEIGREIVNIVTEAYKTGLGVNK